MPRSRLDLRPVAKGHDGLHLASLNRTFAFHLCLCVLHMQEQALRQSILFHAFLCRLLLAVVVS